MRYVYVGIHDKPQPPYNHLKTCLSKHSNCPQKEKNHVVQLLHNGQLRHQTPYGSRKKSRPSNTTRALKRPTGSACIARVRIDHLMQLRFQFSQLFAWEILLQGASVYQRSGTYVSQSFLFVTAGTFHRHIAKMIKHEFYALIPKRFSLYYRLVTIITILHLHSSDQYLDLPCMIACPNRQKKIHQWPDAPRRNRPKHPIAVPLWLKLGWREHLPKSLLLASSKSIKNSETS